MRDKFRWLQPRRSRRRRNLILTSVCLLIGVLISLTVQPGLVERFGRTELRDMTIGVATIFIVLSLIILAIMRWLGYADEST